MEPPRTYDQWSALLDYAAGHPRDREVLDVLSRGTIEAGHSVSGVLFDRIASFEQAALRGALGQLERELELLGTSSNWEDAVELASRFSRHCGQLRFYRQLAAMPEGRIKELDTAICSEVGRVLGEFARHLRVLGDSDPACADAAHSVVRLSRKWAVEENIG